VPDEARFLVDDMRRVYSDMDREIFSDVIEAKSIVWLRLRILAFFVLIIALAVKIAKTTAEVRQWFV
jgi:hypothetical protein